jgi:4-diphosphocytidyl-2-C-methyl-D-erythritol kinase
VTRLLAPGKVNLLLRVGPQRPDGFHELVTVFAALDVGDTLELAPAPVTTVEAPGVPGGDTLVTRALDGLARAAGHDAGWAVRIEKRLPIGAGLGGGSSDAGVALRAANATLARPLSPPTLVRVAAEVGSDVPFFAAGHGAAVARGRGEILEELSLKSRLSLALAWPGTGLSTAEVYGAPGPRASDAQLAAAATAARALSDGSAEDVAAAVVNDLGPPAEALLPAVRALRLALLERGALAAAVSGSGSAVFGLFARDAEASAAIQDLPGAAWVTTARAGL